MEGLRVAPPSTTCAPSASNSVFSPSPAATATTPVRAGARRRSRASICSRMSPTSRRCTSPASSNTATATSGSSVWRCTFSVSCVPDHQHRVADLLQALDEGARLEPPSGDDEVRAVAKAAVEVVRARLPRRLVMGDLRDRVDLAAQPGDDPRQDHHQPVRARRRPRRPRPAPRAARGCARPPPPPPGQPPRAPRPAARPAPRRPPGRRGAGGPCAPGAARPRAPSRGSPSTSFPRPGHARIRRRRRRRWRTPPPPAPGRPAPPGGWPAPRRRRGRSGSGSRPSCRARPSAPPGRRRGRSRSRARLSIGCPSRPVELAHHRAHGQRHVVPGVAVGDREHVQVVDLLAALLEVRVGGFDDPAKALDGGDRPLTAGLSPSSG